MRRPLKQSSLFFRFAFLLLLFTIPSSSQEPERHLLTMIFGGDVTFAAAFENDIDDSTSFPFRRSEWLRDADITMVNLENPITERGTRVRKEYNFRCNPKYASLLKDAGIDIVTLANNHIYDYGNDGVFDTIDLLDSLDIKHVGAGKNLSSARTPVIIHAQGKRIAFLAYLDSIHTKKLRFVTDSIAGPVNVNLTSIENDIQSLRDSADFVVINLHWGVEKSREPTDRQISIAHTLIDFGADLIIGHHPHVLQAIEKYHGKIIAYSLGNFVFGGIRRNTYTTAVLKVTLDSSADEAASAELLPVHVRRWQPLLLTGSRANALMKYVRKRSLRFPESIFKKRKR